MAIPARKPTEEEQRELDKRARNKAMFDAWLLEAKDG